MKKIILSIALLSLSAVVSAQLRVASDGKVAISTTDTPVSDLSVGCRGEYGVKAVVEGDKTVLKIVSNGNMPANSSRWGTGLYVDGNVSSLKGDIGIESTVVSPSPRTEGNTIGILGSAGNTTAGCNYGVAGNLEGECCGAAVIGSIGSPKNYEMVDKYAGFFEGNVYVNGIVTGTFVSNSDKRYKDNIMTMDENGAGVLQGVGNLNPVTYNYRLPDFRKKSDSISRNNIKKAHNKALEEKKHYGLVAQEVREIFPDLVYEDKRGYLSINYTEMIPLLIQSIKELNVKVAELTERCELYESDKVRKNSPQQQFTGADSMTDGAVLYQNNPNPFRERTTIKFKLPSDASDSYIYIFNMQGVLLKQIPISKEQKSISVDGMDFGAGMYIYSLIVNGREIDSKRMILSK